MCYKINQHHLVHDARPIFSYSGIENSIDLVNPYTVPEPCCNQLPSIARWLACPYGHGCCYLTSRIVKCTASQGLERDCGVITDFHTYEERVPLFEGRKWLPVTSLDNHISQSDNCSGEACLPHHMAVLELRSEVEDMAEDLKELLDFFFEAKAVYNSLETGWRCDDHDMCERVLQSHECQEFGLRDAMKQVQGIIDRLEYEISALEVKFTVRRLRFDATASGFTGKCDMNNVSIKL
jgi:hypothetical protein